MKHVLDEKMGDVKFLPWIGENYLNSNKNNALLILGESHYCVDNVDKYITRELTSRYINHEFSHAFWTNIMQVVSGIHHTEQNRADFWHTVTFYNYIQKSLDDARMAPDNKLWDEAKSPFLSVLNTLAPDKIIVLGYRLWDWIDFGGKDAGSIKNENEEMLLWSITRSDGGTTLCGCIRHPSSGFSSNSWAPLVKEFLET